MPYISAAEAKTYLQITGTAEDAWLTMMVGWASSAFDTWTGRTFESAERTEYYSGNGRPKLVLRHRPVSAVAQVFVDQTGYFGQRAGGFAAETLLTAGDNYLLDLDDPAGGRSMSGLLTWLGVSGSATPGGFAGWPAFYATPGMVTPGVVPAGWPAGVGNIKVKYTAGYTTIPDSIKTAVAQAIQAIRQEMKASDFQVTQEHEGPWSITKSQLQNVAERVFNSDRLLLRFRETAV